MNNHNGQTLDKHVEPTIPTEYNKKSKKLHIIRDVLYLAAVIVLLVAIVQEEFVFIIASLFSVAFAFVLDGFAELIDQSVQQTELLEILVRQTTNEDE